MEIHDGRQCFGGYVYVDADRELEKRGMDPAMRRGDCFVRACPVCAIRKFLAAFAGRMMTWQDWVERVGLVGAVSTFRDWFPRAENWACLLQSPDELANASNGKTHALCAAGIEFLKAGRSCRYWNAADLVENRLAPWLETVAEYPGHALIDDLGNEPDHVMSRDAVDRLLDSRYRHRRPTIVTSRLSQPILTKRYPRFMSRMRSGTRIDWAAPPFEGSEP